jgi:hypothetical protein
MKLSQLYPDLRVTSDIPLVLIRSEFDEHTWLCMYNCTMYFIFMTIFTFMIAVSGVLPPFIVLCMQIVWSVLSVIRYMDYRMTETICLHKGEDSFRVSFKVGNKTHDVDTIIGIWSNAKNIFHVYQILRTLDTYYRNHLDVV